MPNKGGIKRGRQSSRARKPKRVALRRRSVGRLPWPTRSLQPRCAQMLKGWQPTAGESVGSSQAEQANPWVSLSAGPPVDPRTCKPSQHEQSVGAGRQRGATRGNTKQPVKQGRGWQTVTPVAARSPLDLIRTAYLRPMERTPQHSSADGLLTRMGTQSKAKRGNVDLSCVAVLAPVGWGPCG